MYANIIAFKLLEYLSINFYNNKTCFILLGLDISNEVVTR